MSERPDSFYVERLLLQLKVVIGTDDELATEIKMDVQGILKELAHHLVLPLDQHDRERARMQYNQLSRLLEDHPDGDALLRTLRRFVPYL